jgi:hypothetical protein
MELRFEKWRAIIDWLRAQRSAHSRQYAHINEAWPEQTPTAQPIATMSFGDLIFSRA